MFDQRGCGRSGPMGNLEDNTTWHLVSDMEALRVHLDIDQWLLFGGSWGSTLALAYAETHPERVSELVLRGIFLLRQWELQWFYQQGTSAIFSDRYADYIAPIPLQERHELISAFYRRLTSGNDNEQLEAAKAWAIWEAATSYLLANDKNIHDWGEPDFAITVARIECHYFVNKGFFDSEDHLLQQIDRIRHIPGVIIQGRYDVVCPMQSAWELHQAWPEAQFVVTPDAGHSAYEVSNTDALVRATDSFRPR